MTTTADIAHDLVALCKQGEFTAAGEKYWADNVRSIEAMGDAPVAEGKDAARGKGEWWNANHEIHSTEVGGPYVNGDQFIVRFTMEVTIKANGQRVHMDETALYTVKDGKIVEERFFGAV